MIHANESPSTSAVADHYDELDPFYREIWGRHVHHGLWTTGRETPEAATEALIDRLADALALRPGERVCDIGCGYGATAAYLAERRDLRVTGLTLSPVQARAAERLSAADPRLAFACRDWLANDLPDGAFDAAYAIESSEHMADKAGFFAQAHRVLRPGGRLGVYAWLSREAPRPWEVRHLLEPICREGRMPSMGTAGDYAALAAAAGFEVTGVVDLSRSVRRTWTLCARRVLAKLLADPGYRAFLLDRRSKNRVFVLTLLRILAAYRTGSMRYGLLTARKP